jgi:hypothetical protein
MIVAKVPIFFQFTCVLEHTLALAPWLGRSSASVLEQGVVQSITLFKILVLVWNFKFFFFQNCPLSPTFPELLPFIQKPKRTHKTQK